MKEFIVICSTILLGITLAGFVMGFGDSAETLNTSITTGISEISTSTT